MIEQIGGATDKAWWEQHWFHAALIIATAVPLLYPNIPPLIDLPGHMGRYRVELDQLNQVSNPFYAFQWQMIGNLGIDLLIVPVTKIFGLELGVKLIVMMIPTLTALGLLWIAREVHGRVTPTALFALPFAYGHPFTFGFVNYTLSMALALNGFALWLRLERQKQYRLRAVIFLIFSPLLWFCHIYGWAALCLLAASSEIIHQHDRRKNWLLAVYHAGINGLSLTPPFALMLLWRSGHVAGQTGGWIWQPEFLFAKYAWLDEALRDRWMTFDKVSLWSMAFLLFVSVRNPWFSFSRNLAASALILLAMYLLIPYVVFGSAYADMRLVPYIFAIALVGIRMRPFSTRRARAALAVVGLAFFATRTVATTISYAMVANTANQALGALDHVPERARLVTFVGRTCSTSWFTGRLEHLPALAIVRRRAFSNDQWEVPGAQLMRSVYPQTRDRLEAHYGRDPSQMVTPPPCPNPIWKPLNWALTYLPREKFDYIWLINPPPFDASLLKGTTLLWQDGPDRLYRIDDRHSMAPNNVRPKVDDDGE